MLKVYMGVCFGCLGYRVHASDIRHVRALVSMCAKVWPAPGYPQEYHVSAHSVCVYIYICVCVCVYVCTQIFIDVYM